MSALWQPTWQAAHAYALTAVVIPSTFGGYTWRCTTAGTSGAAEPTWPVDPNANPTVTDGTVTWSVGTGFRQALQAGVNAAVSAFAQANPTIIRAIKAVRPLSFANTELPCWYLGDMSESIATSQGTRTRTFSGFSGYLVDNLGAVNRMNFAADVLADLFTASLHAASARSLLTHTGTFDTEVPNGDGTLPALEFQFGESKVQEGRI
jgi:hypothetical protein